MQRKMSISSARTGRLLSAVGLDRRDVMAATCGVLLSGLLLGAPGEAGAMDLAEAFKEHDPMSTRTVDHSLWADLLSAHVREEDDGVARVDYAALAASKADLEKLGTYLDTLQDTKVSSLARDEQFAYWANLYNAVTVEVILDHYPVRSIRDINISPGLFSSGPWGKPLVTVEGKELSLDNIEHDILRKNWDEPRVHYAVNCASYGCPNLATDPYTGKTLEAQLDAAARAYVNHPRGVRFDGSKLVLSKIFDWYGKDFGTTRDEQLAAIAAHAAPDLAERLATHSGRIGYEYDWTLNDTANTDS